MYMSQRERDVELVKELFYFAPKVYTGSNSKLQNVFNYSGKHYIEKYRKCKSYMSAQEFSELMDHMEIEKLSNNYYPLRVRNKFFFEWYSQSIFEKCKNHIKKKF